MLLNVIQEKLRKTWSTSTPEMAGETPVRFLGIDISNTWCRCDQLICDPDWCRGENPPNSASLFSLVFFGFGA